MTTRTGLSTALLALLSLLLLTAVGCGDTQNQPPDQGAADASDLTVSDLITAEAQPPDQATPDQALPDQFLPDQFLPDQALPDLPPPSCTDGKQNGDETDVDCGGKTCPQCTGKKMCKQGADCISGVCTAGICQEATCTDGVFNGDETDTDCGGKTCPACADNQKCKLAADCKSGVCTAGVCQKASCTDGIANGDETDTDCGGAVCPACAQKKKCTLGTDCVSGVCTAGICVAASCTDGVQNGDETDIDCGGKSCSACVVTKKCSLGTDCVSGVCTAGVCVAASCTDGIANGDETDTDCGGATCPACAATQKCKLAADCVSGVCTAGVCVAASCTDKVLNGAETDTDCGGGVCDKCAEKKKCKAASDCKSGICTGGVCHPPAHQIASGKTVYFEDLAAIAQVKAITGAKITVESATAAAKFAQGHEVLLINMQGTSLDAASVGNHELLQVASVASADVVLDAAPVRVYGDNKSNISLAKQKVFLVQVLRYSTLTINGTLAARAWTGTAKGLGLVAVRATVKLEVASGGAITTSSAGYGSGGYSCNGVSGRPGESLAPMPANVTGQCYHNSPTGKPNFGGGGGGSYGTIGVAGLNNGSKQKGGLAGLLYGKADLSQIFLGSGGGMGAGGYSGPGGGPGGGQGGGLVYLMAPTLVIKGSLTANGKKGGENANCSMTHGSGSGGGGSGGSVYLSGQTVTLTAGMVTALGAKGGCQGGGAAGNGRVRVDYTTLNGVAFPGGAGALTSPVAYLAKK